jgi:hypothetical protein
MRWLNRLAAGLTGSITAMSMLLILILAGSVALALPPSHDLFPWALLLGGVGARLVWPLFALIVAAMAALLVAAGVCAELRTPRRGSALLLGVVALHAAWLFGIRPPGVRTGVFEGRFVYGHMGFRPDYLSFCEDPANPLPRGADLVSHVLESEPPPMAAIHVPDAGWHGSHPDRWPFTTSDSHGTQSWLVRVRGKLIGPGQYGVPALMQYRLKVDSVLSVAPLIWRQDECGVYDRSGMPGE